MPGKRGEMGGPAEQAFGRLLRQLRRERGLSQQTLADLSGCDRGYVGLLERGVNSPSLRMLFQLAHALGLMPSQLLVLVEVDLGGTVPAPAETASDRS